MYHGLQAPFLFVWLPQERITGKAFGAEEFQAAVRRAVPEGFVFKGFPVQFTHTSPLRMVATLRASAVARDIITVGGRPYPPHASASLTHLLPFPPPQAHGDDVRFALRCRVFPYPEDCVAVWMLLAVRFREVGGADDTFASSVREPVSSDRGDVPARARRFAQELRDSARGGRRTRRR